MSKLASWSTLILLAFVWGSSFILMKRGMFAGASPTLSATEVAALRLVIAWIFMLPISLINWKWMRGNWKALLGVGILGNGIPAFLFTIAQSHIDSSLAGMLNSATPLFALILGVLLFSVKAQRMHIIGVVIGLAGAIGLVLSKGSPEQASHPGYASLAVLAAMLYGASVNIVKHFLQGVPPMSIAALALCFAGPPSLVYLFCTDLFQQLATEPSARISLGYVSILAIVGTALALILFNRLVQSSTALFASTVTYMIPIAAIGWGIMDGEQVSLQQFAFIAVILSGVALIRNTPTANED